MHLRYAGTCSTCGTAIDAGITAVYDRVAKHVTCMACTASPPTATLDAPVAAESSLPTDVEVDAGHAGRSARFEYERRSAAREKRIRDAHPRLGGLILAVSDEPQSTTAWARGAKGEELLGQRLARLAAQGVRVLHDRRIPRTKANIDHIAVAATGVWVIDAKRYTGRPNLRVEGGILRPRTTRLTVGSRDCTKLVEGVHKQVGLVTVALEAAGLGDVRVQGELCFVHADWPLIGGAFQIDGVDVLWPKKLAELLTAPGSLGPDVVAAAYRALASAFPVA